MLDENEMASGPTDQGAADNLPGTRLDDQITLLKNGYEPIPIKRGTKYPEYTWTSDQNVQITEQWLCDLRSDRPDHTSTGLRTGRLVGLDIDISNEGHARIILEDAQQQLGASYFHRIGSKGKSWSATGTKRQSKKSPSRDGSPRRRKSAPS